MIQTVVMGLSGGVDSTTLLGYFLDQGMDVICCSFHYQSKHNDFERKAALEVHNYYQRYYDIDDPLPIDLHQSFLFSSSALLKTGEEIPEGHYQDENMRKTVVPGRNLIFASVMAGIAESHSADYVALGVHAGDHFIYPDCRKEFVKALDSLIYLSSDRKVQVLAPFIDDDKFSILKRSEKFKIKVPYHLTRTCYSDNVLSCGKCGSCNERLEAFKKWGLRDPIEYQKGVRR